MPAVATDDSLIGCVLADKYRIVRQIGKGGMGVVYEAEHLVLGKRVAIKLMLEKYFEDSEAKARFTREAIAASRVGNQHIIDVSDIGSAPDGRMYVVMELLNGKPLSEVLEISGPMPPWRAIAIMRQVLRAAGAAHAKGIIHRDMKPDNIFLVGNDDQHDFVKLLDFGISKVMDPDEQIAFTKLTTTGVVMGTPLYMAPEQAMGIPAGAGADIYACGVILYELLAGRTPFIGNTYAVLVAQLLTAPPEPLQNLRPGLPMALVNAVHRALEKEPHQRFLTAELFAASLPGERTHSQIELAGTLDSGIAVARITPPKKRGKGTMLAVGAALALGVAAGGVLIATQTGAESKQTETKKVDEAQVKPPPPKDLVVPAPATGVLKLSSVPAGAHVFVDGTSIGTSPCEVVLAPGKHVVRFELAGFDLYEDTLDVAVGTNQARGNLLVSKKLQAGIGKPLGSGRIVPVGNSGTVATKPPGGIGRPPVDQTPIGPQKPDPEVKPDKPDVIKKPPPDPNNGKSNPYTKGNPYTKPS